ncbi:MAG TPA: bifunctional phosphopantothenoylcysteine decarboxylase/phosphopantothenate--cysteine ligase CoaBC [Bacteroidia bacterium]|nr:bifunctional phosphopantothenoylcysteine decarboxylase/phosphopantothenate--cysteine ligase CoaBC [Bacteroidia bacterium]HNT80753.1 bifunctional phosphopantothenoylcysteine decarboxylase/phosphopantothenate--cysteine ligase CoaBC [Bacteroidia bacterium]
MSLSGKKILLGISGSIAAYKIAELIRLLKKQKAEVKVVMTASACDFISPLTLSTLSKNKVYKDFYKSSTGEWENHVELGLWADIFLIAPASANTISKFANGLCDNLLSAIYLSARCKVVVAPAMDVDMFKHKATQRNLVRLKDDGVLVWGPASGELASGLTGMGRMLEPAELYELVVTQFKKKSLKSKIKVLITAGPTQEAIDPVRYISNHSSGKMGYALANECASKGMDVILISGPVREMELNSSILKVDVVSAEDMFKQTIKYWKNAQIAICSAAVADYSPSKVANQKIKKSDAALQIPLQATKDILAHLGKTKTKNQTLVGFALETNNELENAKSKLKNKNLDYIVLNSLNKENQVFGSDFNAIKIVDKKGKQTDFARDTKSKLATKIINLILPE